MIDDVIDVVLEVVGSIDPWLRTLLAFVAMTLETSALLGLFVPGDTVVIIAALAVEEWPWWLALIAATVLGALAGESIGFAIGRWIGPAIDAWLARRWPAASRRWRRTERYILRRGGIAIFLSRFLPVAHSLVPLIVGASPMPYRRFLAWTVPACVLWATAYSSAGWAAGGSYRELADDLHGAGYVLVGVIVAFILAVWGVKLLVSRLEARHMRDDDADEPSRDEPAVDERSQAEGSGAQGSGAEGSSDDAR